MRVETGTSGAVQSLDGTFLAHRWEAGWIALGGTDGRLALRTDVLVSAWILQRGQAAESRRQLRLYDEDGRALALIGAAPGWRQTECPLWRTLVNALID